MLIGYFRLCVSQYDNLIIFDAFFFSSISRLKLISAGKLLNRLQTLQDQGIQNNQQIMAIVLEMDANEANKQNGAFDKLQEAKNDASRLLQKEDSYMDVSDYLFVSI